MKWLSILWALIWAAVTIFWMWLLVHFVRAVPDNAGAFFIGAIWGVLFTVFFKNFWQATGYAATDWRKSDG